MKTAFILVDRRGRLNSTIDHSLAHDRLMIHCLPGVVPFASTHPLGCAPSAGLLALMGAATLAKFLSVQIRRPPGRAFDTIAADTAPLGEAFCQRPTTLIGNGPHDGQRPRRPHGSRPPGRSSRFLHTRPSLRARIRLRSPCTSEGLPAVTTCRIAQTWPRFAHTGRRSGVDPAGREAGNGAKTDWLSHVSLGLRSSLASPQRLHSVKAPSLKSDIAAAPRVNPEERLVKLEQIESTRRDAGHRRRRNRRPRRKHPTERRRRTQPLARRDPADGNISRLPFANAGGRRSASEIPSLAE